MKKHKITCFYYRKYYDIYISNVSFSINILSSILDVFLDQKVIVLIESDENITQRLSSICKSIGISEVVSHSPVPRFSAICNKTELRCLLEQFDVNDFDGAFIASINNTVISNKLIYSIANIASSMVKSGASDVSIFIDFSENQMVLSFLKEKHDAISVKYKIRSIFGD